MRSARWALLVATLAVPVLAAGQIPPDEYRARRASLRSALPDGVTLLFGRTSQESDELRSGFVQEANFLYLTGWKEPGAVLMLAPPDGETLFLPARDQNREKYYGRTAVPQDPDAGSPAGISRVLPAESLEAQLFRALESLPKVYTLLDSPPAAKLKALLPLREVADASGAAGKLRLRKSPREVELIRRSLDATIQAHRESWKRIEPGVFEYQVAAATVAAYLDRGCERSAYAPIVASGANATILHYSANHRRMERGDLVLMDAGAECSSYASDMTRTLPVGGRFTPRQLELYRAVLGAQEAVIRAVRPGMVFSRDLPDSLTRIAQEYLDAHGKDAAGNPLGRYLTHLVGHHVGLGVHDTGGLATSGPLAAGMVITVEPGIYIPEEGIGIRIEDMLLVTEQGAEVLSSSLPKKPEELERALAR
jgi:Xaa-Pro aminopeptidase